MSQNKPKLPKNNLKQPKTSDPKRGKTTQNNPQQPKTSQDDPKGAQN